MPISVVCPCGRKLQAKEELAGKRVKCPGCGKPLLVPGPGAAPAVAAPAGHDPLGGGSAGFNLRSMGGLESLGGAAAGMPGMGMPGAGMPGMGMPGMGMPGMGMPGMGMPGTGMPGMGMPGMGMPGAGMPGMGMPGGGWQQQASPRDSGMSPALLYSLIGGGGLVIVALLGMIIWHAVTKEPESVASTTPASTATTTTTTSPATTPPAGTTPPKGTTPPTAGGATPSASPTPGGTPPMAGGATPASGTTPAGTTTAGGTPPVAGGAGTGTPPAGATPPGGSPPVAGGAGTGTPPPGATPPGGAPPVAGGAGGAGTAPGATPPGTQPGQQQKPQVKEIKIPADPPALTQPSIVVLGQGVEKWKTRPEPPVGMRRVDKVPIEIYHYSWLTDLLPFLGHDDVYHKFDLTKSWADDKNEANCYQLVREFLNPADTRSRYEVVFSPYEHMALSHFVGMAGIEDTRTENAGKLPRSHPNAGVFGYDAVARLDEITDGASQTIAVIGAGEIVAPWVQGGGASVRGARATIVNGQATYFDPLTGFGSRGLPQPGAQVLMADGSVRVVSADIDPKVFRSMCTIHGADSVDLANEPHVGPFTP